MKRIISIILLLIMLISPLDVLGAVKSDYFSDLKVGLDSMAASSITVTLNGDYIVDGAVLPSGTSFVLYVINGMILYNEKQISELSVIPVQLQTTVSLKSGSKNYKYRGSFIFKVRNNLILPINIINVEDYLKGVVPKEIGESSPMEALKAQAVAARSYALSNKEKHRKDGYDVCDTVDCQVYAGYDDRYVNSIKAVDETKGVILTYGDRIISAYFSASNGGYTEASGNPWTSSLPYLIVKQDTFDNDVWPYKTSNGIQGGIELKGSDVDPTKDTVEKRLKAKGVLGASDKFLRIDLNSIVKNESTRIASMDIVYLDANGVEVRKSLTKEWPRIAFGFRSTMYDVLYDEASDTYTFVGKGYGHGVGLSQIGAKNRALAGQSFVDILKFYYEGVQIEFLNSKLVLINTNKDKFMLGEELVAEPIIETTRNNEILFKYELVKDGAVVAVKDYSNDFSFRYVMVEEGDYVLKAYIKNVNSSKEYDDYREVSLRVFRPAVITNVVLDRNIAYEKKLVNISIVTDGGSGEFQYKVEVYKDDNLVYGEDYVNTSVLTFVPDSVGEYVVKASLKDENAPDGFAANYEMKFSVVNEPSRGSQFVLKKGSKNEKVTGLQKALNILMYNVGTPTGYFGDKTYAAVVSYQKSKGLKATGEVDDKLYSKILEDAKKFSFAKLNFARTLKYGMKGEDVKKLQVALNSIGYKVGIPTGYFGVATKSAVIKFQKANKLKATGAVDKSMVNAVNLKLR